MSTTGFSTAWLVSTVAISIACVVWAMFWTPCMQKSRVVRDCIGSMACCCSCSHHGLQLKSPGSGSTRSPRGSQPVIVHVDPVKTTVNMDLPLMLPAFD
jgi:hypothetical protein